MIRSSVSSSVEESNQTANNDVPENQQPQTTCSASSSVGKLHKKGWYHKVKRQVALLMSHCWTIFVFMLYRIWMYRRRHLIVTIVQLSFPALVLYGMTVYLGDTLQREDRDWTEYPAITEQDLMKKICENCTPDKKSTIAIYIPITHQIHTNITFRDKYLEKLTTKFDDLNIDLKNMTNEDDLLREEILFHLKGKPDRYIAGIKLEHTQCHHHPTNYYSSGICDKFYIHPEIVMAQKVRGFGFEGLPLIFDIDKNKPDSYNQLLGIQMVLCRAFYELIREQKNISNPEDESIITMDMKALSYPPHTSYVIKHENHSTDTDLQDDPNIDTMLSAIFVLSFIPVLLTVVYGPVTEKESGFKLYLHLMGFSRGAYWFSWILNQMIIQLIVVGLQLWLLFYPFESTGALVKFGQQELWVANLLIFNFYSLCFCVFIAAFFTRGIMGLFLTLLVWLLFFHLLHAHISTFDFGFAFTPFIRSCLIPTGAIHWVVLILTAISSHSSEVTLNFSLTQQSGFKLADVMIIMSVNSLVYFLLTSYVDFLHPGPSEYGRRWNYFFKGMLCRFLGPGREVDEDRPSSDHHIHGQFHTAIEFRRISKKFHLIDGVYGIENVTFRVLSSQITVMLGHKDSGKSTLMRVLCGEYVPSSGTIFVHGYNIRKQLHRIQSLFGVCMEGDVLCEYLTVMEHMQLVAVLKGLKWKDAKKEAKEIFEEISFTSQINEMVYKLVKWQRRVLCIAMALLGNSPILLLDEPTVGLELEVKRQIRALLEKRKKKGTTILMASDDIDEAYEIADRIVILSKGKVAGVGPPKKLEKLFETGYHLKIKLLPNVNGDGILDFLKKYIPSVRELDNSLITQVERAIYSIDWDEGQSQTQLLIPNRKFDDDPVESVETGTNTDFIDLPGFFPLPRPNPKPPTTVNVDKTDAQAQTSPELKATSSTPAVIDMPGSRKPSRFVQSEMQRTFLLQFQDRPDFPKLFQALDEDTAKNRLGIKTYDLIFHDMRKAFAEVDDYVGVLDARRRSDDDIEFEDFFDIKTLRLLVGLPSSSPVLLDHSLDELKTFQRNCCIFWQSLQALMLKRIFHLIGNYRQALIQILAPGVLFILTIVYTNAYFHHHLITPSVTYNASGESSSPLIPYRYRNGTIAMDFFEAFESVTQRSPNNVHELVNIKEEHFKDLYTEEIHYKLHDEIIIAADFTKLDTPERKVTTLFSLGHYFSAPASLLIMFNTILKYEFPEEQYTVELSASSMFHTTEWLFLLNNSFLKKVAVSGVHITLAVSLSLGYFIFTSGFVTQPCAERMNRLKRYQMYNLKCNGVYWLSFALVDGCLNVLVFIYLSCIVYFLPTHNVFKNPEFLILFILTGTLGGFASIIHSYSWSHFLLKEATSYYATLSINQFLGLFLFLFYTIINFQYVGESVEPIFILLMQVLQPFTIPWNFYFAVFWAVRHGRCAVLNKIVKEELCSPDAEMYTNFTDSRSDCCHPEEDWNWDFIPKNSILMINFLFLIIHCILGVVILMYLESKRLSRSLLYILTQPGKSPELPDAKDAEAVEKEKQLVENLQSLEDHKKYFLVHQLSTFAFKRKILQPMSFALEPGKCTAIIGPEASGVTVLFEILAGIRAISNGGVTYNGYSLFSWKSRRKFLKKFGLCSAADITISKLTGVRMLKLFGRLRGISSKDLPDHINYWIQVFSLQKIIKKRCESYSVVVRRKLAVAIAAIGYPPVMIFEEPTKDLDPLSRGQVNMVLDSLIRANHIVLILNHDVSSIQNICDKIIFLVNGQMQFCGEKNAMLAELSQEFTLILKLKGDESGLIDLDIYTKFKNTLENEIESIILVEEKSYSLTYRIKDKKYTWTKVFEIISKLAADYESIIQDYQIRRASLDDVFRAYAEKQLPFRRGQSVWKTYREKYW